MTTHHLKPRWGKISTHQTTQVKILQFFPNPLMSVNNVDNFDAHTWQKNTILIEGDSRINGINEKGTSTNFISVKTRCFTCEYQQFAKRNIISDLL